MTRQRPTTQRLWQVRSASEGIVKTPDCARTPIATFRSRELAQDFLTYFVRPELPRVGLIVDVDDEASDSPYADSRLDPELISDDLGRAVGLAALKALTRARVNGKFDLIRRDLTDEALVTGLGLDGLEQLTEELLIIPEAA